MTKRRPAFDPSQQAFDFFAPAEARTGDGALAGMERMVSSAVGRILRDDPRNRFEIAGGMSALLDDDVTKSMLDAYSAEAKETHNISFARFLALIAETQRYDVLGRLMRAIGADMVVGEEAYTVELGHLSAEIDRLKKREQQLKRIAQPINREGQRR